MTVPSRSSDPSQSERPWLQFKLRTLFAVVTACAVVLSFARLVGPAWGAIGAFGVGTVLFWWAYSKDDSFCMLASLVMFGAALASLAVAWQ